MRRKNLHLPLYLLFISVYSFVSVSNAQVTSIHENFDNVIPAGWSAINQSTPLKNQQGWGQGNVRYILGAHSGAADSYAGASYLSAGTGTGTVSNWLITPEVNFQNTSTVSFYTRTVPGSVTPDRLEVRLSANGASTNVGSGPDGTGDFSTLLLTVNPDLESGSYPDTGWTEYTVAISGVSGTGRIAFRYYVTDGGSSGANSFYIGIDDFSFESILPVSLFGFKGMIKNDAAFLTWSTADELNNKGFEIQLSRDNKNFVTEGFVAGHGTTAVISNYSYTDDKLLSGTNYYRLKQIDNDGKFNYSYVVKLDVQKFDWKIYGGNPYANSWIQLQTKEQCNVAIQVVSFTGQVIQTINKGTLSTGTYTIPLNLQNASHGIYAIRLLVDKNIYSKNILR